MCKKGNEEAPTWTPTLCSPALLSPNGIKHIWNRIPTLIFPYEKSDDVASQMFSYPSYVKTRLQPLTSKDGGGPVL